ncbi:MAG: hypothetical protein AAFO69_00390 [Bacteroidota bacterium]
MKFLIPFLFMTLLSLSSVAQDSTGDSTTVVVKAETEAIKKEKPEKVGKGKKDGFGESLLSLGKGFLERLKYRFNLEAVEEKVEKTQKRFKKKDNKSGN